jgi:hypothetical protein
MSNRRRDLGSAPKRVLNSHSSDQIAHLFADPWSATARAGFPSSVRGEAHSMPTHYSLEPDDGYGVENARTATIEPNEQGAVDPTQMQSAWCALLQDTELMPQYQDFGFQPPPQLEAVTQHADEKEGNCNMRRSCSDSLLTASQVDGVFGTGKVWAHDLTGAGNVVVALLAFRADESRPYYYLHRSATRSLCCPNSNRHDISLPSRWRR